MSTSQYPMRTKTRTVLVVISVLVLFNWALLLVPGKSPAVAAYTHNLLKALSPNLATAQEDSDEGSKIASLNRMRELQELILALKAQKEKEPGESIDGAIEELRTEYRQISAGLGGDEPPNAAVASSADLPSLASVAASPTLCSATTTSFTNSTPASITSLNTTTSTINVSGAGPYLWDVDLRTFITHTFNADLDITLTSPSGSSVTISSDNGGSSDNVFNGTIWDDQAASPVTDFAFANNVVAANLQVEEALGRFAGENPNGTWTLSLADDSLFNSGTLSSWSLAVSTFAAAPVETSASFSNSTPASILSNQTVTSTISVSVAGSALREVALVTNITHTDNDDLDITLTAPSGRIVTITTDNADDDDNVFNGTVWDDDGGAANPPGPVTDTSFSNNVVESVLVPEGAMTAFSGEDPNGAWTLTVTDDASGDTGTLNSWSLIITTATCATDTCAGATQTFSNSTPAAVPDGGSLTQTITVSGTGLYLSDLNLRTFVTHTNSADIDLTLTSPAGTVVTLTTDNGGSDNNVFNGTLWDDQADPDSSGNGVATDHNYSNNVLASPLAPEEALGAFIGEDADGVWTLTINDDSSNGSTGAISTWSLEITTLAAAPTGSTSSFSNSTAAPISAISPAISPIVVTGLGGRIGNIRLTTNVTHTACADLDITLTSPSGRTVTITTDNGGSDNNLFNGTLWDDKAGATNGPGAVTDASFTNNVTETPLVPEEAMSAFNGENPNGVWVLTIEDDTIDLAVGNLSSWSLEITTITCCTPPSITVEPASQTVCDGQPVSFLAGASGNPTPTVQWQVSTDGGGSFNNLPGETADTLSFTAVASQSGHSFRAVYTNVCGTATTTAAMLVVGTAPGVSTNPADQTVCAGATAMFTVAGTGMPAPTVQWQTSTNGGATFSNVPSATSTTLSFAANAAQNGHRFRAVFTNTCGSAASTAAILTVNTAPVITLSPTAQSSIGGGSVTFTAAASGSPAPTVQWQTSTNGGTTFSNVPGATSPTLTFTPTPSQHGNIFRAVFTNVCGTATTSTSGSSGALSVFDQCLEQFIDSGWKILYFNSLTGDYRYLYCRKNIVITGRGLVTIRYLPGECKIELRDSGPNPKKPDRTIFAIVNPCTFAAQATIIVPGKEVSHVINDANTRDNQCRCR